MLLIGTLLISPLWGSLSPRLFFHSWLSFLGMLWLFFNLVTKKELNRKILLKKLFQQFTESFFSATLLLAGFLIIYKYISFDGASAFGRTPMEIIVYWVFATIQLAIILPKISFHVDSKLKAIKCPTREESKP